MLHGEWKGGGGGGGGLVKTFSTVPCVLCAHAYALGSPGARHIIRGGPEARRDEGQVFYYTPEL